ncbi:SDR family oxidoreductase [Nocardia jiangxiensis]|uniref:SDR family oxidoreductase n=1 Tax=Nocardia jiangxiensis TaxID=282685 RepID=UPI001FE0A855|nr:SDR family oxidoreductase [Nocardia jiangxiensis]
MYSGVNDHRFGRAESVPFFFGFAAAPMTMNEAMARLAQEAVAGGDNSIAQIQNAPPIAILKPSDISDAVAFLVSDQAKRITGVSLPVDAGFSIG